MLLEEGLDAVFARHARFGAATREAVRAWGLETQCRVPEEHSEVLTGVRLPPGLDADRVPRVGPGAVRHVPRPRSRQAQGPHVPHRPSRRLQRSLADGHPLGRGDGAARRLAYHWRAPECLPRSTSLRRPDRHHGGSPDARIAGICQKHAQPRVRPQRRIRTPLDRHGYCVQNAMSVRSAPTQSWHGRQEAAPKGAPSEDIVACSAYPSSRRGSAACFPWRSSA